MQTKAYAKLNLTLDILRRRDDGYHDLQMVMQSIDLAVQMQQNGEFGAPVPDYTAENVSVKVARIIQSYTGIVDRFIWRK